MEGRVHVDLIPGELGEVSEEDGVGRVVHCKAQYGAVAVGMEVVVVNTYLIKYIYMLK